MKKAIIVIIAVILLVAGLLYSGVIPGLSIVVTDTTKQYHQGNLKGTGELLGPLNRKGYIISWKDDGFSENIRAMSKIAHVPQGMTWKTDMTKIQYKVYGKENAYSSWTPLSIPGDTKRYISNPNPGEISLPSGEITGGIMNMPEYDFSFVGSDYHAVRVTCEGWIDWNTLNWFDDGYKWRMLQEDEAVLYEGHGGLYLPRGIDDDRPYSTFEIGQTVKIRVETTKGGATVGESDSWKVTLNEPYGGSIEEPDAGGAVVKTETYGDDHIGYFTFTVTEEMAQKSMNSQHPYSVRIWNTVLPRGTLHVDFLDFIAKAPSDVRVYIDGTELVPGINEAVQTKVGDVASVEIRSDVNEETGLAIDYFRVSIIYGTNNILLPSEWSSHLWILHTTNVPATGSGDTYSAIITYTPQKESYVSIHVKAFDTAGRGSPSGIVFTSWSYATDPVPDDVIVDETGTDYYGGGRTSSWIPWDPSGGNWEVGGITLSWLGVLVAFLIIMAFAIAGFGIYKKPQMMLIFALVGLVVAVLVYAYFFTNIF